MDDFFWKVFHQRGKQLSSAREQGDLVGRRDKSRIICAREDGGRGRGKLEGADPCHGLVANLVQGGWGRPKQAGRTGRFWSVGDIEQRQSIRPSGNALQHRSTARHGQRTRRSNQVEHKGLVSLFTFNGHLSRVGPFKLIRGDPGRPDGWIHPDMVVNEEVPPPMEYDQEEIQSNRNSEQVLLFHLDEDPYEKKNLATEYPAITQYLAGLLDQYQVTFLLMLLNCLTFVLQGWDGGTRHCS